MNTRIAVPLSKEAYEAISLLAKVGGISRGKFVADALEASVPSFILIARAYRAAMAVEGDERAALVEAMAEAEKRLLASVEQMDLPLSDDLAADDGDSARTGAGVRAAARSNPPAPNRGVQTSRHGDN